MPVAQTLERAFRRIYGKPCWGVKQGHGSFLTFEFGESHVVVHEPVIASRSASPDVRKALARRRAFARGQWHLWIYCCSWQVLSRGRSLAHSESSDTKIHRAADLLNGQKLVRFSILPRKLQCIFEFDLGGTLKTEPYDKESEQWLLYEPSKKVLLLRADSRYKHARADVPKQREGLETSSNQASLIDTILCLGLPRPLALRQCL
jgi:hypothetical protein